MNKSISFFNNLPQIYTERLLLRKYEYKDVPDVYEYTGDPEVTKHLSWNFHTSEYEALEFLNIVTEQYLKGEASPWAIELRAEKKVIGSIGIVQWDPFFNRAEIGFVLNKKYWNKGFTSEAINAVLKCCFETLNINRVEATCEVDNKTSAHVLKKAGMTYEGTLRDYGVNDGVPVNMKIFSILKMEWDKKRESIS